MEEIIEDIQEDFKLFNYLEDLEPSEKEDEVYEKIWENFKSPFIKDVIFSNDVEFFKDVSKNNLTLDCEKFGHFIRRKMMKRKIKTYVSIDVNVKNIKRKILGHEELRKQLKN